MADREKSILQEANAMAHANVYRSEIGINFFRYISSILSSTMETVVAYKNAANFLMGIPEDVHKDMYISTPPTGGSCGFTFVEGEEYIVYGHDSNYADGGYTVGICSRTALLGQAQADIDALGEGNAPQAGTGGPAPEEPQDTPLPNTGGYSPLVWATALVVGIGAALAAGGVGLMVRSRRLSRRRMEESLEVDE